MSFKENLRLRSRLQILFAAIRNKLDLANNLQKNVKIAVDQAVFQAKIEIIEDIVQGTQPIDVSSFEDLNLYVNADDYGDISEKSWLRGYPEIVRSRAANEVRKNIDRWLAFWPIEQRVQDGPPS